MSRTWIAGKGKIAELEGFGRTQQEQEEQEKIAEVRSSFLSMPSSGKHSGIRSST
jgi:hypothetical protein